MPTGGEITKNGKCPSGSNTWGCAGSNPVLSTNN